MREQQKLQRSCGCNDTSKSHSRAEFKRKLLRIYLFNGVIESQVSLRSVILLESPQLAVKLIFCRAHSPITCETRFVTVQSVCSVLHRDFTVVLLYSL